MSTDAIVINEKRTAMKITSEISHIGGAGLTSPDDAAVFLIDFDGRAALVDAG